MHIKRIIFGFVVVVCCWASVKAMDELPSKEECQKVIFSARNEVSIELWFETYLKAGISGNEHKKIINSNYRKLSLWFHPDRCSGEEKYFKALTSVKDRLLEPQTSFLNDNPLQKYIKKIDTKTETLKREFVSQRVVNDLNRNFLWVIERWGLIEYGLVAIGFACLFCYEQLWAPEVLMLRSGAGSPIKHGETVEVSYVLRWFEEHSIFCDDKKGAKQLIKVGSRANIPSIVGNALIGMQRGQTKRLALSPTKAAWEFGSYHGYDTFGNSKLVVCDITVALQNQEAVVADHQQSNQSD